MNDLSKSYLRFARLVGGTIFVGSTAASVTATACGHADAGLLIGALGAGLAATGLFVGINCALIAADEDLPGP